MSHYEDFLFARPSFLEGLARVIDMGGTLQEYNGSSTPEEADAMALRADWNAVGQSLSGAMDSYATEHADELTTSPERDEELVHA